MEYFSLEDTYFSITSLAFVQKGVDPIAVIWHAWELFWEQLCEDAFSLNLFPPWSYKNITKIFTLYFWLPCNLQ